MAKLAFHIGDIGSRFLASAISLSMPYAADDGIGPGQDVLLFCSSQESGSAYCAKAIIRALARNGKGQAPEIHVGSIEWFGRHVPFDAGSASCLALSVDQFDAVLAAGLGVDAPEFTEAASPFRGDARAIPLETYEAVWQQVLTNYGFVCALTGSFVGPFEPTPIKPREAGGELHAANILPLIDSAWRAFLNLHLTIGLGFEIIVDSSLIDPELAGQLNPSGRLIVPQDRQRQPDMQSLAWHRAQFFARLGRS